MITQTCYPILKPNLKIVSGQNAVILSKIMFLLAKKHVHIFIMLVTSMQSFKLIACKPWEKVITQTCYPVLKAYHKVVLRRKCHDFVKNYFCVYKNSHAHLEYIHNKHAWFQNAPLKTVRGIDYTNSIPYNAKRCLNQHLQPCMARTTFSSSAIRSAKIG